MHSATSTKLAELAAIRTQRARLDGREAVLLAELAALPDAPGKEWIREDVAIAMRLPPMTAHQRLHDAAELQRRLPDTVTAMQHGRLSRYFADKILDATESIEPAAVAKIEARVLERVGHQTLAQFSRSLRRAVIAHDTRNADDLADKAREQRRFEFQPSDHAMAELRVLAPLEHALAIRDRVQTLADTWKGLDDRTADQRRVDALVQLCLGDPTLGGGVKAQINITMPLDTLLGAGDEPAELDGEPLPAALARAIAADPSARWRRFLTAPMTGQVLDIGRDNYEPTTAIRRHVTFRDPTCRFPGCGHRSTHTELDHVIPWAAGGPTADFNLIPLCSRHHHIKHDAGWLVERARDGTVRWFSPNGVISDVPPDPPPI